MPKLSLNFSTAGLTCGLAAAGILFGAGQARAQSFGGQRLGPDLLETLGVGSRSISMGNAYTAIADDASASFWNVGRLGFMRHDESMLEYRSVINSSFSSKDGALSTGISPSKPQLGFAGLVMPITSKIDHKPWIASIGISYTEGGYFSATKEVSTTTDVPTNTISTAKSQILVRDNYLTLGYGQQFTWSHKPKKQTAKKPNAAADQNAAPEQPKPVEPSRLGVGLGVFFVNQEYGTQTQSFVTTGLNNTVLSNTGLFNSSERGTGVGATFGVAYDPANSPYTFGLSYRSKTSLSGLVNGQSFGSETPEHLSIGVAYKPEIRAKKPKDASKAGSTDDFSPVRERGEEKVVPITISAEMQMFSAANLRRDSLGQLNQLDQRQAITNLHIGAEYRPPVHRDTSTVDKAQLPTYEFAFRLGFHTNANAATVYTYYDNVVSFGAAIQRFRRGKLTYSLEPAVEMMVHSGLMQYTLTGRVSF